MGHIQMRFGVQPQVVLPDALIDGQKIAGR